MSKQKNVKNKSDKSISSKESNMLMFQGDVFVNDYFISELKKELKKNQNQTIFYFTIGLDVDDARDSILEDLNRTYECKITESSIKQYFWLIKGKKIINKNEVPDNILLLQNYCSEHEIMPIDFSIIL